MDEDDGPRRRQNLNPSMSYFQNVQNSLLLQTRRLTTYLTSDDKNATKALQQASYTAMSTLLLIICLAVAICIYFILEPFLRPLLWALLCGTLLHPLKYSLTERFKLRIKSLDSNGIPLMVGITIAPVVYLNEFSDFIETQFLINWKVVTSLSLCCILLYSTIPYNDVIVEWLVYIAEFVDLVIHCVDPWLSHVTFLHVSMLIVCVCVCVHACICACMNGVCICNNCNMDTCNLLVRTHSYQCCHIVFKKKSDDFLECINESIYFLGEI